MPAVSPQLAALLLVARREAEFFRHAGVSAEHLLLAIAWEGHNSGAETLTATGMSEDIVAAIRERLPGTGDGPAPTPLVTAMQIASEKAKSLGHDHVGTAHLLFAFSELRQGILAEVFSRLGITQRVREEAERWLTPESVVVSRLEVDDVGHVELNEVGQAQQMRRTLR